MLTKDKAKALNDIDRQIIRLMKQSMAELKKPPAKRMATMMNRCGKFIRIAIQIKGLEMQKRVILSHPMPKFPPGSYQNNQAAAMGHDIPETIIIPKK